MSFEIQSMKYRDYRAMMRDLRNAKRSLMRARRELRMDQSISMESMSAIADFCVKSGIPQISMEDDATISMEAINSMLDRVKRALNKAYEAVFNRSGRFYTSNKPKEVAARVEKLRPRIEKIKGSPQGKITDQVVFRRLCINGRLDYNLAAFFGNYSGLVKPYSGSYIVKGQAVRKEIGEIVKRLNNAAMNKTLKEDTIRMEFEQFCSKFTAPTASLSDKDLHVILSGEERIFADKPVSIKSVKEQIRGPLEKFAARQYRSAPYAQTDKNQLKFRDYRALAPKEMLVLLEVALKFEQMANELADEYDRVVKIINDGPCNYAQVASFLRPAINFGADGLSGYYLGMFDDIYRFTADDMLAPVEKLCVLATFYAKSVVDLVEESLHLYKD